MKKTLLAVLLCTVMLMTILPASAFAEGETEAVPFYIGNAMNFADTNDSLWAYSPTAQLDYVTMEAWVKADTLAAGSEFIRIMYNGDSGNSGYGIYLLNSHPVIAMGGVVFTSISAVTLTTNRWYHLAAVRAGGYWTFYVNGTAYTPPDYLAAPNPIAEGNTFTVGNSNYSGENFRGSIDEVRYWTVGRTAQQIRDNMYIKLNGNETGLLAYYNFDQGIAGGNNTGTSTVTDLANGDNNLTISNFALNGNSSNFVSSVQLGTFALENDAYTVDDGGSVIIPIVRSSGSEGSVTINYATTADTSGLNISGSVTFAEGETIKNITVSIPLLSITEPKQFSFTISGPSGVSFPGTKTATVTIRPKLTGATLTMDTPLLLPGTTVTLAAATPAGATYDCAWFTVNSEDVETSLDNGNSLTYTVPTELTDVTPLLGSRLRVRLTAKEAYCGTVDATTTEFVTAENTVSFDANGGTPGSSTDTTAAWGKAMPDLTGAGTLPSRGGYTFAGYWDAKTGGNQYYNADGSSAKNWDKTADTTLYAQWDLATYTVTYDDDEPTTPHSGGDESYTMNSASLNLPTTAPTKTGYTFAGWKVTGAAQGGTGLALNDSFNGSARTLSGAYGNVTLTAQWTANEYTVTLDANGGTAGTATEVTASYGAPMPALIGADKLPSRSYYTFTGYWDAETGGNQYYNADGSSAKNWDKTENTTLYAQWDLEAYSVTYDDNGETTAHSGGDMSYTIEKTSLTLPTAPARAGYTFTGWRVTDAALGGTGLALNNEFTGTSRALSQCYGDVTLTAQWTANEYTVTLDANGGINGIITEKSATYDVFMDPVTGDGALPSRAGYSFEGYWDATTGGDKYYDADGNSTRFWDKAENTTLYARWTADSYTVTYDDNGATTAHSGGDESYTIENASLTLPTAPLKTGYTFDGWKVTSAAQGGTGLALNDKFTDASRTLSGAYGAVTLQAQWTANEYAVTLDGQGATVAGAASVTATYDTDMPNITSPQRVYTVTFSYNEATGGYKPDSLEAAYSFNGYFNKTVGGTMYYDANIQSARVWDVADEATLYAHWTASAVTLPEAEKTGFDLAGWYTDAALTTLAGAGGASYTPTANVTLYAKWAPKTYAVTLTPGAGYTLTAKTGSVSPVTHGGEYTFIFELNPAYSAGTPEVLVNGVPVMLSAGSYTISNITEPITVSVTGVVAGYPISLADADLSKTDTAEIDGVEYSLTLGTGVGTATVPDNGSQMAVVTTEKAPGATDVHSTYPEHMTVWELTFDPTTNSYTADHIEEFDDLLQYSGCSIRLAGTPGIRMITSVPTRIRDLLKSSGVNGYTLEETGTLVAWASKVGTGPLTLNQSYAKSAFAYMRGVTDPIFAQTGELTQYTNVLIDFTQEQCIPDLIMRPYIILRDSDDNLLTIYGGTVQRSIGYIAWQNRAVYAKGTAAYNYVWNIINYCRNHGVTF